MGVRIKTWLFGALYIGGFLLGGSDGPYFPWPNVLGGVMLLVCVLIVFRGEFIERVVDEHDR